MRWSDKSDDNLEALLRGEDGGRLGAALAEMREKRPETPPAVAERIRALATQEPEAGRRSPWRGLRGYRFSFAHAGALAAAVLVIAVAIPIATMSGDGGTSETSADAGSTGAADRSRLDEATPEVRESQAPTEAGPTDDEASTPAQRSAQPPPPPPRAMGPGPGGGFAAPSPEKAAPLPSTNRAQDYSAQIKLHVADHDELSNAVQSAIRSTRQLGGYVTYVDYGTSGSKDGNAELAVRVPIGRVQTAVARFSELGTILEQQTEIVDLQGRIDRITRNIQQRRDRIAKLEAELRDPTLSETERDRLEAKLVQAKRGLANATGDRAGVLRQSRFAKLDLAFTTEKREEPAAPPSELRKTLEDAIGILAAELAIGLFVLIVAAPLLLVAALAWLGARAVRRAATDRLLETS